MNSSQGLITVQGYVVALPKASGKDENTRVAIITENGSEYRVLHKGAGVDFVEHISANVEATGVVSPLPLPEGQDAPQEIYTMLVRNYRLTDGFGDSWYDNDEG